NGRKSIKFLNPQIQMKIMLPLIVGILVLLIAIYIGIKILKNIITGVILIFLVLFGSFLIFGSLPNLREIPVIGQFLPSISGPQDVILAIKNILYNIEIVEVSRDSLNNLLIAIANTGKLEVSQIRVFVDNQSTRILNSPKDPLKSGEITLIQTDWNQSFSEILVQTKQVNTTYKKS
ncbi:MAG: hypothetical protein NZ942_00855, partial [Candidatus Aenigmarchaeota archaeon]|nr:hypothetical protein [Candidatus Aenigmarchaeota archaeon]